MLGLSRRAVTLKTAASTTTHVFASPVGGIMLPIVVGAWTPCTLDSHILVVDARANGIGRSFGGVRGPGTCTGVKRPRSERSCMKNVVTCVEMTSVACSSSNITWVYSLMCFHHFRSASVLTRSILKASQWLAITKKGPGFTSSGKTASTLLECRRECPSARRSMMSSSSICSSLSSSSWQ